ncbi:hypothetical protein CKO09_02800 [Chromatium weissei]|nr:hypothetical protein [Chromatium weissei]
MLLSGFIFLELIFQHPLLAAPMQTLEVPLLNKRSLARLGAAPDPITDTGRLIAQKLFDGLKQHDTAIVSEIINELENDTAKKNIGGSYSALQWLAKAWISINAKTPIDISKNVLDNAYHTYFLSNDAQNLKEYLQVKYAVSNYQVKDPEAHVDRRTFLEDYLIFNNPARDYWDATQRITDIIVSLHPQQVIDVGAGFGYFSQRFAEALGKEAVIYATDTQKTYVNQLQDTLNHYGITGIHPVLSTPNDINIKEETADLIFISSLYHVLYIWNQQKQRDAFIDSLRGALRSNGYLVILDNRDNDGLSLHNSFLSREFVIAQLYFYGFELVKNEDLSPFRYVLVFRKTELDTTNPPTFPKSTDQPVIRVTDSNSLVHIGSLDSFDITPLGVAAATLLLKALSESDQESARAAISIYQDIIPKENFGGEYTALQWIAEYITGSDTAKSMMTQDRLAAEFLAYLAEDNFAKMKLYLSKKYKLKVPSLTAEEAVNEKMREIGIVRREALEDFILFNNPKRENWEKSSRILKLLDIKKGDTVVDLGSGPGFFSFKFAEKVGSEGIVYSLDTKDMHIEYLAMLAKKWGLKNIHAMVTSSGGFELPKHGTADIVFMCSLYHVLYAVSSQAEREGVIHSVIKALRPTGKLVIVDNGPVEKSTLPYHGPYIRKELIQAQLEAYGFKLEAMEQIIPQRYLLVFTR